MSSQPHPPPLRFELRFKTRCVTRDTLRLEHRSIRYLTPGTCSIFRNWSPSGLTDDVLERALGPGRKRMHPNPKKDYPFRSIQTRGSLLSPEHLQRDFGIHFAFGKRFFSADRRQQEYGWTNRTSRKTEWWQSILVFGGSPPPIPPKVPWQSMATTPPRS